MVQHVIAYKYSQLLINERFELFEQHEQKKLEHNRTICILLKIGSSNTTLQIYACTCFLISLIYLRSDQREISTGNDHVLFLSILEEKSPRAHGWRTGGVHADTAWPAGAGSASAREVGIEISTALHNFIFDKFCMLAKL